MIRPTRRSQGHPLSVRGVLRSLESLEARHLLAGDFQLISDSFTAHQNQGIETLDVLSNDLFPDDYAGAKQISSVSFGSEGGTIRISDDRAKIEYAPPADFDGEEVFTYFVDGQEFAEVRIDVQSPLTPDDYEIPPDGQLHTLDVLQNDPFWADYPGAKRITLASVSSAGSDVTISADGKSILYRPTDEQFGRDQFIYIVDEIYPARVTISVPQTTESDRYEVVQNSSARTLNVLANDPFWPGYNGERRITSVTDSAAAATIEISATGSQLLYTPAADFSGWDSFHYVVDDRFESYVYVVVHRPVQDDWSELDRNSTDHLLYVLENDTYRDLNNVYRDVVDTITDVTQPESGGVVEIVNQGGNLSYTPPRDFSGQDVFTYVADGKYEATVRLQVTRPVRDDYLSSIQDVPEFRLPVLENDFLGNGYDGAREITAVTETEQGGLVSVVGGAIAYTPPAEFTGHDSFSYTVDDDLSSNVSVYVEPLAQSDWYQFCANPTHGAYTLSVMANDLFHRGYEGPARITSASSSDDHAQVTISPDGRQLLFEPSSAGGMTLSYTVDDKYTASVWVGITGHLSSDHEVVNQNSDQIAINVLSNDFRRNGTHEPCPSSSYVGPRVITDVTESTRGGVVALAADGKSVSYTPPEDFFGTDQFTYEVDGIMSSTVVVNVIRRVRDDQYRVNPGEQESMPVLVNDLFGADYRGSQRITDVTASQIGATVEIAADGESLVYNAPAGVEATDTLTYTVDGALKAEIQVEVRPEGQNLFPQFETLADFEQFLLDDALERYDWLFGSTPWGWFLEDASGFEIGGPAPDANLRDHSETNVQVAGVDEGDIVEFDSDFVYMLTGNDLVILDAWPAEELSEVSRQAIEGQPIGEFLKGDRLTVISEERQYYPFWGQPFFDQVPRFDEVGLVDGGDFAIDFMPWYPAPSNPKTTVTVFDVSDRTNPQIIQKTRLEGRYIESRGVGDHVYLVLSNNAVAPPPEIIREEGEEEPWQGTYETREQYIERFRTETGDFIEAALPNYSSYGADGELARSGLVHQPEEIYQRLQQDATNLLSLVSIDVTNTEPGLAGSSGVYTDGAAKVYASIDHFYVFENGYDPEDGVSTRILKFDWDGESGEAEFVAAGQVAGWMLNQFSADEFEGHLRIATTINNSGSGNWTGREENDLFVLRDDGGVMEFVGSLQNLALNETIRSVRFMGERAFVVTYRNVDPLFGLDVSDPADPRSIGHLTLPGFSSYMQLIDEDHLLAVGRNTPTGGFGPAQVSLFDVSDLQNPTLVDEFTFERFSTTEAAIDHHAFGYFATHGLFAVPASQQYVQRVDTDGDGYRETREWIVEHELMVFRVDVDAAPGSNLELAAQIEHDSPVRRSGYVGDKLYSVAQDSVKVVDVADPSTVIATAADLYRVEEPQPPIPLLESDAQLAIQRSQQDLADRLAVDIGEILAISAEPAPSSWQVVFRVEDQQYLYESTAVTTKLVDDEFEFSTVPDVTWQNPSDAADVNDDGDIAPNDAILIINELTRAGSHQLPSERVLRQIDDADGANVYLDASGDGYLSPLDALLVINRLNDLSQTKIDISDVDLDDETSFDPATIDRVFGAALARVGDSNRDGRFDSADLVRVFQAGEYEDLVPYNSTWAEGDWNGDREFGTDDFVLAFKYGNYENLAAAVDGLDLDPDRDS